MIVTFLENLPMNHWSTFLQLALNVFPFIYVLFFFFSKTGRDERGRGVFAKASMITFMVTIFVFLLASYRTDLFEISERASSYLIHWGLAAICVSQACGIYLFNRFS